MINNLIKQRSSPRAFDKKGIENEKILSLFEAAHWAPSSMNEQPRRFIIALKEDSDNFTKMVDVLNEQNKVWAKTAPLLVLTNALLNYNLNEKPNRFSYYDVGQAIAYLTFQATAMNLYVHQMGGFNVEKARELFQIPRDYAPISVLAIGYKGNPDVLPENLRIRENTERKRKPLESIVYYSKFGEPFEFNIYKSYTNQ
jgi:nitroreductase